MTQTIPAKKCWNCNTFNNLKPDCPENKNTVLVAANRLRYYTKIYPKTYEKVHEQVLHGTLLDLVD